MIERFRFTKSWMFGPVLTELTVGQEVHPAYQAMGRMTVMAVKDAKAIILEEGHRYFNGLYTPKAWASPCIWVVTLDRETGTWLVDEEIDLARGKQRRKIIEQLKLKYNL